MNRQNETWNLKFSDLFRGVSFHDDAVKPQIQIPDEFYQRILDFFMERSYLNETGDRSFVAPPAQTGAVHWLRITHLPVNPTNDATYDLLGRWQGVLSTMHSWNYRIMFLLMRKGGETRLYLGTSNGSAQGVSASDALEQLREAAHGSMPGIGLQSIQDQQTIVEDIILPLNQMRDIGAVTGIPAFRPSQIEKNLQTLDPLAFGIKDEKGQERDYALLVVADPMQDQDIAALIARMRELGSNIHSDVQRSINMTRGAGENKNGNVGTSVMTGLGGMLANLLYAIPGVGFALGSSANAGLGMLGGALGKQISFSSSGSLNTEYLDKFAQYAEQLTDMHIERLKAGRSTGFWNTGVYVLGSANDVRTVTGMLRSIYSGKESYLEPIRTHLLSRASGAKEIVGGGFNLLPMIAPQMEEENRRLGKATSSWHLFGEAYQYLSTPINTAELSLATSLPRRDVPGLRFVRTAVRFASNPAQVKGETIRLGNVMDMGVPQGAPYVIDPNLLVRHALITGVTGCGKSTTCQKLISELIDRDIPVLIIEPAKDDYVRWAMKMNESLPEEKQFRIYMPGANHRYPGAQPLEINLFEPAAVPGAPVNLLQHSENMSMLLNACLPSEDVVPILIDETVERVLSRFTGEGTSSPNAIDPEEAQQRYAYPRVRELLNSAMEVMDGKGYEPMVRENMKEVLKTRFKYLARGTRGKIFDVTKSMDYHELFAHPTIINLDRLAGSKEKSLIMSLLLLAMYEYRASAYQYDDAYRAKAQQNKLMHLTLIEEAHNVLAAVPGGTSSGDPRAAAGELFSNILAEIRQYGEGIAVVDQIPTKLLPDVLKNTNLKICHRLVAPDDCEALASSLALRDEQRTMIPALGVGNAIICGDLDDAATWVKMDKPPKKG